MKRRYAAALSAALVSSFALGLPAHAAPPTKPTPPTQRKVEDLSRIKEPDKVLAKDWRTSTDRIVTTNGDDRGLHLLLAEAKTAYQWRGIASLLEPGYETDQWIGQACLTASGTRAAVVYAPREFGNNEQGMTGGAFAAIVDLSDGRVTKLAQRVSLAYFNPGCGAAEDVIFSRQETTGRSATRLLRVDARTAAVTGDQLGAGQLTSPVPHGDKIVAASGNSLVELGPTGPVAVLARTTDVPYRIQTRGADVGFQVVRGDRVDVFRYATGTASKVAEGRKGELAVRAGGAGQLFLTGSDAKAAGRLPAGWRSLNVALDADLSTEGRLAVTSAHNTVTKETGARAPGTPGRRVAISTTLVETNTEQKFELDTTASEHGSAPSPALGALEGGTRPGARLATPDYSTVSWDPDRACAVPRNDPHLQTYQPTPAQVEWAADLAVQGKLTFTRAGDWANNGLPGYSPQTQYPHESPDVRVPAQVLLGILAQESNLWQASLHVVDGSSGNVHQGGFYGNLMGGPIDFTKADCGYGIGQVTTGMTVADTGRLRTDLQQKIVALDYASNVAAAEQLLQQKWNETRAAGLIVNDGDPRYIENWWFAIWAYNTGFHPQVHANPGDPWGVGWLNNPANPIYLRDRHVFLTAVTAGDGDPYDNSKHPNLWSYPERIIGWANTSLRRYNYTSESFENTYRTATWPGPVSAAQPPKVAFCVASVNQCDPNAAPHQQPGPEPDPAGPCQRDDLACWWHGPVRWINDCSLSCGHESASLPFPDINPRPYADNVHPEQCDVVGLPAGAQIVDDVNDDGPIGPDGCARTWTRGGSFAMKFSSSVNSTTGATVYPSKQDFHQIGGGFGGHFWFAHTDPSDGLNNQLQVVGTWTTSASLNAWSRVFVHIPDHGAQTHQATYQVYDRPSATTGKTKHRTIPTTYEHNTWVPLGVFDFTGGAPAKVSLSNLTSDGVGTQDIAYDAMAFSPLPQKPTNFVVAMGDSYSSGEGTHDFSYVSNQYGNDPDRQNACRQSPKAWSQVATIPGAPGTIGQLSDALDPKLDYHLIACSGARTDNVLSAGTLNGSGKYAAGQYGQLTQMDQGYLDENTTVVTLSIGGNDARFTAVITGCIKTTDCSSDDYILKDDPYRLNTYEKTVLDVKVRPSIEMVLQQIYERAPNAKIVLMTYPLLFELDDSHFVCANVALNHNERVFLDDIGWYFDSMMLGMKLPPTAYIMRTVPALNGHAICTSNSPTWINGLIPGSDGGGQSTKIDPDNLADMDSFHPTAAGYTAIAALLNDKLNILGVHW